MNRFGRITKMMSKFLAEIQTIGGVTKNNFISPKGIYSKPKDELAIIIPMGKGTNIDVILALEEAPEKTLEDGDVYLTDKKSFIHFMYEDGDIFMKAKNLKIEVKESFEIKAKNVELESDLKVSGTSELESDLKVSGTSELESDLKVTGKSELGSTLKVRGASDLTGLDVTGDMTNNKIKVVNTKDFNLHTHPTAAPGAPTSPPLPPVV